MSSSVRSDVYMNLLSAALQKEWEQFVTVAMSIEADAVGQAASAIAFVSKVGKDSIERKLRAVQHAVANGMTKPVLVEMGQEAVVSSYNRAKKVEQVEQQVWLKFKVSGTVRDAFEQERDRIVKILKFTNSEMFIIWLHAQLAASSDDEIRHSAGEAVK